MLVLSRALLFGLLPRISPQIQHRKPVNPNPHDARECKEYTLTVNPYRTLYKHPTRRFMGSCKCGSEVSIGHNYPTNPTYTTHETPSSP